MEKAMQPSKRKGFLTFLTAKFWDFGGWDLWKSFLICLGGAFVSYSIQRAWGQSFWAPVQEFSSHIPVAFLVAAILTLTIEYNTAKRGQTFRDRIAKSVFEGLSKQLVPIKISDEINFLLKAPCVKKRCKYVITFAPRYPDMLEGYFVLRREMVFRVKNLTARKVEFPIVSSYSAHPDRNSEDWKRDFHLKLAVGKEEIDRAPWISRAGDFDTLNYTLVLNPNESKKVYLCGEEPSRVEAGSNSYTMSTATVGIQIDIKNLIPEVIRDISVFMHHPAFEQPGTPPWVERYGLDKAFLPGQGFEIRWRTVGREAKMGGAEAT